MTGIYPYKDILENKSSQNVGEIILLNIFDHILVDIFVLLLFIFSRMLKITFFIFELIAFLFRVVEIEKIKRVELLLIRINCLSK